MTTYAVLDETPANEIRSTDTMLRIRLEKGAGLTLEDKALISLTAGATLTAAQDDSFSDRVARTMRGDAHTVRQVTATGEEGAIVEIGSGTPEPRVIVAVEVDSLNGSSIIVGDGAWVGHTEGVEADSIWVGMQFAKARERTVMTNCTGQGIVFVEGGGVLVKRELAEDEVFTLGQARLVAHSDTVTLSPENVAGRWLHNVTGPGTIVYKSHAENT